MPERDQALTDLEQLYASLPQIDCQGHCWNTCGPISVSALERTRLEEAGVDLPAFTHERAERWNADEKLYCPALKLRRCTVYEIRPLICRVWGTGRGELACRHGCTLTGPRLRLEQIMALLMQSFRIGGRDSSLEDYLDLDVGEAVMTDPRVVPLMVRFTNGERGPVEIEMRAAMEAVLQERGEQ